MKNQDDSKKLNNLRKNYKMSSLSRSDLRSDPIDQFKQWFEQAINSEVIEANAMVLGTYAHNRPSSRTVLLKGVDRNGFVFYTNYGSRKAEEISHNSNVSLLFPWYEIERQVIILGKAERISKGESKIYFASRPVDSKIGAWVSPQSKIIDSRRVLEEKWNKMKIMFSSGDIPKPENWGGYKVVPFEVEFWQGRESRLHDRFRYTHKQSNEDDKTWMIERIAP